MRPIQRAAVTRGFGSFMQNIKVRRASTMGPLIGGLNAHAYFYREPAVSMRGVSARRLAASNGQTPSKQLKYFAYRDDLTPVATRRFRANFADVCEDGLFVFPRFLTLEFPLVAKIIIVGGHIFSSQWAAKYTAFENQCTLPIDDRRTITLVAECKNLASEGLFLAKWGNTMTEFFSGNFGFRMEGVIDDNNNLVIELSVIPSFQWISANPGVGIPCHASDPNPNNQATFWFMDDIIIEPDEHGIYDITSLFPITLPDALGLANALNVSIGSSMTIPDDDPGITFHKAIYGIFNNGFFPDAVDCNCGPGPGLNKWARRL